MPSIYIRGVLPNEQGVVALRYKRVPDGRGRRPDWVTAPFYVRYTDNRGRQVWSEPYKSIEEAEDAKVGTADVLAAQAKGLTVAEAKDHSNIGKTPIKKAVEDFLDAHRNDRPKTRQQYATALNQLLEHLPRTFRFVPSGERETKEMLTSFLRSLESEYSAKTIETRMGVVFSMLKDYKKETGVEYPSTLVKLPKSQTVRAKAYSSEEIQKLFSAMSDEEQVRYLFFLHSACREQEVQYATWDDLDLIHRTYRITGEAKSDVGFVPKNHEERTVRLTTELAELLRKRKRNAPNDRWLFVNEEGLPEGHFLRKFKAVAKRAGLNCGRCKTTITDGKYENKKRVEVTCEARPVCEKHYLHRLRKTRATQWLRSGIDLMKIKTWLGHKSLAVTQIYLSDESTPDEQDKVDAASNF